MYKRKFRDILSNSQYPPCRIVTLFLAIKMPLLWPSVPILTPDDDLLSDK